MEAERERERKVRVAELSLRAALCALGAVAAALVGTDAQTRTFFGSFQKTARFTSMRAMVFLVGATAAAAGYSLLQAARCCVAVARGRGAPAAATTTSTTSSRAVAVCIFACDQALAYAVLAAVAAALQASVLAKRGQQQLQWAPVCDLYAAFCRQAGAGIASAVAAGVAAAGVAFISAFNLFRLYGGDGKSGAGGATTTTAW